MLMMVRPKVLAEVFKSEGASASVTGSRFRDRFLEARRRTPARSSRPTTANTRSPEPAHHSMQPRNRMVPGLFCVRRTESATRLFSAYSKCTFAQLPVSGTSPLPGLPDCQTGGPMVGQAAHRHQCRSRAVDEVDGPRKR